MTNLNAGGTWGRLLYWLPVMAIAVTIFILSSVPDFGRLEDTFLTDHDKITHIAAYTVFAWTFLWGWEKGIRYPRSIVHFVLAVIVVSLYGISDEFHQSYVPGRKCSAIDWLADTVGGILGAMIFAILAARFAATKKIPTRY